MSCTSNSPIMADLPSCMKGDTYDGWTSGWSSTGNAFAAALAGVRVAFVDENGVVQMTLTDASGITVNSTTANAWNYTIDPFEMTLPVGRHSYGEETTDENGVIKTRVIGLINITTDAVP